MENSILHIDSSGRSNDSSTRKLSGLMVENLKGNNPDSHVVYRNLSRGLPFVDEKWIEATFTEPEQRTESQQQALDFSTGLVKELQQAEKIVIGIPIYNFSIPAVLKAWIDMVARVKLTFEYTANGPVGLLQDKKVFLAFSSGGVAIGSDMDFASSYMKHVLGFIGLTDVTVVDASKINLNEDGSSPTATSQLTEILV